MKIKIISFAKLKHSIRAVVLNGSRASPGAIKDAYQDYDIIYIRSSMNIKVPRIENTIFSTLIEVRVSDINYGNHLGHDSAVSFFHEARVRFLKGLGYSELNIDGFGILITNLIVNYINEAFYSDKVTIKIGLGEVKKTSIDLIYNAQLYETDKMLANAITTITFYDFNKRKAARIPKGFLTSVGL